MIAFFFQFAFMMMAITCTLCPLARDYTGLILYAVGFGMFDGCFILLIAITTCDLVGPERLPQALGTLYGVVSLPIIFGPPLAGTFDLPFARECLEEKLWDFDAIDSAVLTLYNLEVI